MRNQLRRSDVGRSAVGMFGGAVPPHGIIGGRRSRCRFIFRGIVRSVLVPGLGRCLLATTAIIGPRVGRLVRLSPAIGLALVVGSGFVIPTVCAGVTRLPVVPAFWLAGTGAVVSRTVISA